MIMKSKKIETYLEQSRITLFRLKSDLDVKAKALEFGYTDERIDEGIALYDSVNSIYNSLITLRGERAKLSFSFNETFQKVSVRFSSLKEILRSTFYDDPEAIKELGLIGSRERAKSTFIAQAGSLFSNIVTKPHILAKIAHMQLTAESLQPSIAEIVQLQGLNEQYTYVKGECQKLLLDRNKELRKLKAYMMVLKRVLTRLFKDENPQTLERLGIFVRNQKKKKPADSQPTPEPEPTPEPTPEPEPEPTPEPEPEPEPNIQSAA